jgi:hypothetical protein
MTRAERTIAIVLGIVLGITIIVLFVFLGSNQTIDAPRLDTQTTTSTAHGP